MSATLSTLSSVHQTQVDLGGLMTVLGQHLYSTPIVAVRELVQNAHDSLVRRRMEDLAWQGEGKILVEGDLAAGVLRISDCGAGLTADEIHSFLATVGVGYTRKLRESSGSENLIGLFGLGFLSAFVLAEAEQRQRFAQEYRRTAALYYQGQPDFDVLLDRIHQHIELM